MPATAKYLTEAGRLYALAAQERAGGNETRAAWLEAQAEKLPELFKQAQQRAEERRRVRRMSRV